MNLPKITFKIEDRIYSFDATDAKAIRNVAKEDRQHLLTLLSAIQKQSAHSEGENVNGALSQGPMGLDDDKKQVAKGSVETNLNALSASQSTHKEPVRIQNTGSQDRLGKGDVDDLMSKLIAQERNAQKKPLSKNQMYLYLGAGAGFILLLVSVIS